MNFQPVTRRHPLEPYSQSNLQSVPCDMRRFIKIATLGVGLLFGVQSFCQARPVIPQTVGHADQATCLILERMGAVDQVASRVLSFGIHGKQFQYIEGKLPEGFLFHDKLTEHDVRNLQAHGSEVIVLNSDYMPDDLQQARAECRAETRKMPIQADTARIEIASSPFGTDIELDGKFIGSTPSSVKVSPGEHTVKLTKIGYSTWERKIMTHPGSVRISPELEPSLPALEPLTPAKAE